MIVMDKPLLDSSPQEGNSGSYSRSLRVSSTLENFRREYFCKISVVTKITKNFSYKILVLYDIILVSNKPTFVKDDTALSVKSCLLVRTCNFMSHNR